MGIEHEDVDLPTAWITGLPGLAALGIGGLVLPARRAPRDPAEAMREKLALTIFVATAVVVASVVVLAEDSTWAVLGGAALVLLLAATVVAGAALATADEEDDRSPPGPPRRWRGAGPAAGRRPSTWRPVRRKRRFGR
jgi:peptidoglycan/LPS O-acetylase OafA/YrhL